MSFEEKRKSVRIRKSLAVQYGVKKGESFTWDMSLIKDISEQGMCLGTSVQFAKDDVCYLRVRMPTVPGLVLDLQCVVIDSRPSKAGISQTRVVFLNVNDEEKARLREYIEWAQSNERGGT